MEITAKIKCNSKTESLSGVSASFCADYANGANQAWAESTPSLNVTLQMKPEVAALFSVGASYTLTFTPED